MRIDENVLLPGRLLLWPNKRSYTHQPTAEFHTFGSPPLLQLGLEHVCQRGARLAEPGEFTLRAFLSGRIDLPQAEAVLAVIDSNNEEQVQTALRQLAGGLTGPLSEIRNQLISIVAELEAGLDFVEEDIEFISKQELLEGLLSISANLQTIVKQISSRNVEQTEFRIALVGAPNVGKSSLFNRLVKNDIAIVADVEGTTRDFVSAKLDLGTVLTTVVDTAGFETSSGLDETTISQQAQRQTQQQFQQADLRLVCVTKDTPVSRSAEFLPDDIVVITKADTISHLQEYRTFIEQHFGTQNVVMTSARTGEGIDHLTSLLNAVIQRLFAGGSSMVGSTATRATDSLKGAFDAVFNATEAVEHDIGLELVASELRISLDEIGRVVGTIHTDDILDRVFSQFCIGK